MQRFKTNARVWKRSAVVLLILTGIVLVPMFAIAQSGLNQVYLPSIAGSESSQLVSANTQTLEAINEVEAAHYDHGHGCRVKARGLTVVVSDFSVDETVENLKAEIDARPLNLVAEINHAANAAANDLELRPTTLLLFGNPNVGTPLMQSNQTIGIDLPQKFLVWEDECGTVRVGYNAPRYLRNRHRIWDRNDNFDNIANVLNTIATAAITE